jgi:protease-4
MSLDIDEIIDRRRLKRRLTFWRVIAVLVTIALVATLVGQMTNLRLKPYVARVSIDGIITEDHDQIEILNDIAQDDNAVALVLLINSPGGTTTGAEGLYKALRRVAAKKPLVASLGTLAASGGYVTAIAADHIVARETTITGSIGVILEYTQFGTLLNKVGVDVETVKSGALKGEPSLSKPLSDKGREALQSMIDDSYQWFTELVSARRKIPLDQVRILADGRAYTGRQALKNGLIDELGGEEEALKWLETKAHIAADLPVVDMDKTAEQRILGNFMDSIWSNSVGKMRLPLDGMTAVWQPTL